MINTLGVIITLCVAAISAYIANVLTSTNMPGGIIGSIIIGLVGSWVGGLFFDGFGPHIGGIAVIPATVGSIFLIFLIAIASGRKQRYR